LHIVAAGIENRWLCIGCRDRYRQKLSHAGRCIVRRGYRGVVIRTGNGRANTVSEIRQSLVRPGMNCGLVIRPVAGMLLTCIVITDAVTGLEYCGVAHWY